MLAIIFHTELKTTYFAVAEIVENGIVVDETIGVEPGLLLNRRHVINRPIGAVIHILLDQCPAYSSSSLVAGGLWCLVRTHRVLDWVCDEMLGPICAQ